MATKTVTMDDLLNKSADFEPLQEGQILNANVLEAKGKRLSLDLGPYGLGVVPRRELGFGKTFEKNQEVEAMVLSVDADSGLTLMSVRRAHKNKGWKIVADALESGEEVEAVPVDCNKGGLLIELDGAKGFLPVSQLSAENYPKIGANEDKSAIEDAIRPLVGKPMMLRVIALDRDENKLIFSQKGEGESYNTSPHHDNQPVNLDEFTIGDTVKGKVTGIVDYGAFVAIEEPKAEGMIHISELSWKRVASPSDVLKVDEEVELKVISLDNNRLGLSLKQTIPDPWEVEIRDLKLGDTVKGKITRITSFGAFVQATPSIEALVHISEVGGEEGGESEQIFKLDSEREFEVVDINHESHRIFLGLPGAFKAKQDKKDSGDDQSKVEGETSS